MGWTAFDRYKDKWVLCSKAKTWRAFNNAARTIILREEAAGLVLEEWPKDGGRPVWRKMFPAGAVEEAVQHVVRLTAPSNRKTPKKTGK